MPPLIRMDWRDLAFLHWPVPPAHLQPRLPPGLRLDTLDGSAWVGLVPFRMTRVRPLGIPLPGDAIAFPEVNLRTYVRLADETPAVWFLSLDGDHRMAAVASRRLFAVPYHHARIAMDRVGDQRRLASSRQRSSHDAEVRLRYGPTGPVSEPAHGSFAAFASDRMTLVAGRSGRLLRTDVHHGPWRLGPGKVEIERNTLAAAAGLALPDSPPVVHIAEDLEGVEFRRWPRPA